MKVHKETALLAAAVAIGLAAAMTVEAMHKPAVIEETPTPAIVTTASTRATTAATTKATTAMTTRATTVAPQVLIETVELPEPEDPEVILYDVPLDDDLQRFIISKAMEYDIDPAIVMGMIYRESTYRADVIGDSGRSFGLMQIQKRWHKARMERLGVTDLLDPYQNVTVGIDILAGHIDSWGGNVEMALVAYNMGGEGAKKNCFDKGIYSSKYSRAVLAKAEELQVVRSDDHSES